MPKFSISRIIAHRFHVYNDKVILGIGYDMIVGCDLMIQLGLSSDFKLQVLKWDGLTAPTKDPSGMIGKTDLTSCEMRKVVM